MPEELDDRARSMALSSHHMDAAELEAAAAAIRDGRDPGLPAELVSGYVQTLQHPANVAGVGVFLFWAACGAFVFLVGVVVTIAAFVSGEVSRGLYRLGGLAAWWFIFVLGTWALWLYHGGRPAEVDRLVPLKWKVVLGALPAAALCVAIVVCFVQGRF